MSSTFAPYLRCPNPLYIIRPLKKVDTLGKISLSYETAEEAMGIAGRKFYGVVRTFQGTRTTLDTMTIWEDTAEISTRYNPQIERLCRVYDPVGGKMWEVVNEPENLYNQALYTIFTVKRVVNDGKV